MYYPLPKNQFTIGLINSIKLALIIMANLGFSGNISKSNSSVVTYINRSQLETILFQEASENFKSEYAEPGNDRISIQKCGSKRKAVWEDECMKVGEVRKQTEHTGSLTHLNTETTYKEYILNKFDKVRPTPKWADLDNEIGNSSEEQLTTTVGFLEKKPNATFELLPDILNIKKLKNLSRDTNVDESISSLLFHPSSTISLIARNSGIATIHAVDGYKNEKLHSIKFNGYPITCARFYEGGCKALFGASKNYFFSYDLMQTSEKCHRFPKNSINFRKFDISPCEKYLAVVGRFGEIHLLDLKSKEIIHKYKQEGTVTSIKFSKDLRIFTHSSEANVNILNIKTHRIEHCFIDDGCVQGRSIDISKSGSLFASGSQEGVVNLYNYEDVFADKNPKPIKAIFNLTTPISDVKFNPTSDILGFCSDSVPGAVKLFNTTKGTVFSNFPGFQNKLHRIKMIEFSPSSGYMGLGSVSNEVSLYRLKHFNNY